MTLVAAPFARAITGAFRASYSNISRVFFSFKYCSGVNSTTLSFNSREQASIPPWKLKLC